MTIQWSYSALKHFEQCARSYAEIKIFRNFKKEDIKESIYGEKLHHSAEMYVKKKEPLPPEHKFIQPVIDAMLEKKGSRTAEYEMAVTKDLVPCAWFSEAVWVRGKADLMILERGTGIAWVVDWKSGNDKYADKDQLDLMSLLVFAHCPEVTEVRSALLFVVKNSMVKHKVLRSDADRLWKRYRERVAKIEQSLSSGVWNPTSSGLCRRHCVVTSCEFNGRH